MTTDGAAPPGPTTQPRWRPGALAGVVLAVALVAALVGGFVAAGDDEAPAAVPTDGDGGPVAGGPAGGDPSVSAETSPSPDPPLLLPNMRSLPARDLRIERTPAGRLLRFTAALANTGPGPLLLLPLDTPGCGAGRHPAVQVLHFDRDRDRTFHRGRDRQGPRKRVGCMLEHPDHDHWHFDAMAGYVLRDPASGEEVAARRKVSFCLRDNERVQGAPVAVRKEHFGECSRHGRQGISPGWADVYEWDLSGQTLELPGDVDGRTLCLDLTADPRGVLDETDESDNGRSVALVVDGDEVRRVDSTPCRTGV